MEKDKAKTMFFSLVYSFQMQSMIHLGKMANPVTSKIERDMNAAEMSIDMLEMLQIKTEGKLEDDEKSFLDTALTNLRLNYTAEKEKPANEIKENTEEQK